MSNRASLKTLAFAASDSPKSSIKLESLREFYRGHFCLGNPRGRVVVIDKFVGRHENRF